MHTRSILAAGAAILFATQALAVTPPSRVRGTVTSVTGNQIVVAEADGTNATIALADSTKYAGVVKSSLDDVDKGDFIGTATKGPKSFMVALEVVIFPDSMKGTGEGQYPWDKVTDTTANGSGRTGSTMTNGTVSATQSSGPKKTNSTMTNGTVSAAGGSGPSKTLTVTYDGKSSKIIVPPTAPIVKFQPGEKSLVVQGGKVFVVADGSAGHLTAKFVAVGQNGVVPPM